MPASPTSSDAEPSGHETDSSADDAEPSADDLDYGPSGYLPSRASARARKIVLRAPLGIQWVIASVVAGVVVVIAGVLLLNRSSQPPAAPFEATLPVTEIYNVTPLEGHDAIAVSAAGPVWVYVTPSTGDLVLCEANGRLESTNGVWAAASGRGFGVESLQRHPSEVHDGTLYVDFTSTIAGPAPSSTTVRPEC